MNPIAVLIETVINVLRLVRNLVSRLLPAPEYVVLSASGTLPERRTAPPGLLRQRLLRAFAPAQESLEEWRERLRLLAAEPRVKGVVLKVGNLPAGPASVESLRGALAAFRQSGKRLVVYLPAADLTAYYLASVADTIVVPESAELLVTGPRLEATFLRTALDRLGILPEFHHIAEYKTAANRFLHSEMPVPQREMLTSLLDHHYEHVVGAIAHARGLPADEVRRAVDEGVLTAADAMERRLVDAIAFEDELPRLLSPDGRPAAVLPWALARRSVRVPLRWHSLRRRQAIAVVQLLGTIVPGESRDLPVPVPLFGSQFAGHETIARAFRLAERIPVVKALVFHVDSGGGSAVASDLIWREVARVQSKKPVVVYMGNVAGSGGYYVSCGARHIVASATTLTGSIGVVSGKFNIRGLYEKGGLRREILARGETATLLSAFASYTDREWAALRRWMDAMYARFKDRVAAGRQRPVEEIESIARGRVWTGAQALERGLIDELGDFDTAVSRAKTLAGIPAEVQVPVVTIRPPQVAGVPAAGPAAWAEALRTVRGLLREPALLLVPPEAIKPEL